MTEPLYPVVLTFAVNHEKKDITYNHLYKMKLEEVTEQYNSYCKKGVKNQTQFEQDMIDLATAEATKEFEDISLCACVLEKIQLASEESRKTIISIIENRKDFQTWVGSPHPQNKPPSPIREYIKCECCKCMIAESSIEHHICLGDSIWERLAIWYRRYWGRATS